MTDFSQLPEAKDLDALGCLALLMAVRCPVLTGKQLVTAMIQAEGDVDKFLSFTVRPSAYTKSVSIAQVAHDFLAKEERC